MVVNAESSYRRNAALNGAHWLVGAAVTVTAAVIATLCAIVFAATMAVVVVIVGGAVGAWAAAARLRAPKLQRAKAGPVTLEARKVGHAWVAYGWDQSTR